VPDSGKPQSASQVVVRHCSESGVLRQSPLSPQRADIRLATDAALSFGGEVVVATHGLSTLAIDVAASPPQPSTQRLFEWWKSVAVKDEVLMSGSTACFADHLRASLRGAEVHAPKNAHIYNCGDRGADFFLVESGQVKTVAYSRDGKECLLHIYGEGDILGELCLLPLQHRTETATAMCDTVLQRIPLARFRAALADVNLLEAFLAHLTLRLSTQQEMITNLVTMDSEQRLAAALLNLGHQLGKRQPQGICIEHRITQEDLSGMVGTTRSRVGLFLKRFRDAGLVQSTPDARLVIHERNLTEYLDAGLPL